MSTGAIGAVPLGIFPGTENIFGNIPLFSGILLEKKKKKIIFLNLNRIQTYDELLIVFIFGILKLYTIILTLQK